MLISLSTLGNGDPDLVVSKGLSSRPTPGNSDWAS